MKALTGEIGKISFNGEQIGGFKYWTVNMVKSPLNCKVVLNRYWFFKKINSDKFIVDFYTKSDNKFKQLLSKEITLKIPDCELDKMINETLTLELGEFDWLNA